MRIRSCLLLLSFSLLSVPIEAKQGGTVDDSEWGIRNGFSVTTSYLPTRYPRYDYDAREWGIETVSGMGLGVCYNLSYTFPSSWHVISTGLGYTFCRIDQVGNQKVVTGKFIAPGQPVNPISGKWPDPFSLYCYRETLREYSYVYIPFRYGFRLCSKGNFSFVPYWGLRGKYSIGYTEKDKVESATWFDHYFELFDYSSVESEAERFMIEFEAGVDVEYKNLFLSLGFVRDAERMFRTATDKNSRRSFWGPYAFNCWQLGLGINF